MKGPPPGKVSRQEGGEGALQGAALSLAASLYLPYLRKWYHRCPQTC